MLSHSFGSFECVGVVVAPGSTGLQKRHASKLCRPDDERVIQHAALLHVGNQSRSRLVHDLGLHRMRFLDVRMRVPIGDSIASGGIASVEQLNDANAFLEQSSRENAVLRIFLFQFRPRLGAIVNQRCGCFT